MSCPGGIAHTEGPPLVTAPELNSMIVRYKPWKDGGHTYISVCVIYLPKLWLPRRGKSYINFSYFLTVCNNSQNFWYFDIFVFIKIHKTRELWVKNSGSTIAIQHAGWRAADWSTPMNACHSHCRNTAAKFLVISFAAGVFYLVCLHRVNCPCTEQGQNLKSQLSSVIFVPI